MSRVADYIERIDDPSLPPLILDHPADGPLLEWMVHLAAEDGEVQGDEFALLQRLRADLAPGALLAWAASVAVRPPDLEPLRSIVVDPVERFDLLRLAARMVAMDGEVAEAERGSLWDLAELLSLPDGDVERALDEVLATGRAVSEERVRDALRHMRWEALLPSRDPAGPELSAVVPEGATPLCTASVGGEEVMALFAEGLALRCDDGTAFVRWEEIARYTRIPVVGAAFHLQTTDGRELSIRDPRLGDAGALVDQVFERPPVRRRVPRS